jgi:hypothetical protein
MSRLVIIGAMLLFSSCVIGPTPAKWVPANTAQGLDVTLRTTRPFLAGELLAVEDTALFVAVRWPHPDSSANTPRLARVATRHIRAIDGPAPLRSPWRPQVRERYRMLSRYPQGVSPALEAQLVAAYGADAVRWVTP